MCECGFYIVCKLVLVRNFKCVHYTKKPTTYDALVLNFFGQITCAFMYKYIYSFKYNVIS